MAAIMTLSILMARRLEKEAEKPFYVAYIDISKAFDTVNHEKLWEILNKSGIEGKWVENLKELYKDNQLRSFTPEGKTSAINLKRGIRQGCPLSPLLFALYVNPIAIAMERANPRKTMEPAMLMYADDMVVWGETEVELKEKLTIAIDTMDKLGLNISAEKTEVQHNKWVHPTREGETLEIETEENTRKITYKDMKTPLRYLGAWSTTNMETEKGMQLLKDKMQERLDRIKGIKATPSTKVQLIRSRIVSVWNYTAAVQKMEAQEIAEWEKKFYEAITIGEFQGLRKDMVYEKKDRAGFGMTKMQEEYECNRLRTVKQIMEAGERIKGRGQTPWAQKLLLEELERKKPCMKVIEEIKELIGKMGLKMEKTGEKYKRWQRQETQNETMKAWKVRAPKICTEEGTIGGVRIPAHMIDFYTMHQTELKEGQEAWEKAVEIQEKIINLKETKEGTISCGTGLRLKDKTIEIIENIAEGTLIEWGGSIDNRSTENIVTDKELLEDKPTGAKLLLINVTNPDVVLKETKMADVNISKIGKIIRKAVQERKTVIILGTAPTQNTNTSCSETVRIANMIGIENAYGKNRMAKTADNKESITISVTGTQEWKNKRILGEITRSCERNINNMYNRPQEIQNTNPWICPLCKEIGERIDKFGICRQECCKGIRTESS